MRLPRSLRLACGWIPALALALALVYFTVPIAAQAQTFDSVRVISGLTSPVYVAAPEGDERLFVVERAGVIKIFQDGAVLPTPFLNITGIPTGGEQGLLSIAFPPNFSTTGFFYIYYISTALDSVIVRHRLTGNPNVADPNGQVVIRIPQVAGQANHKGGTIKFGPDGMLWCAMGDGGGSNDFGNNAQNDGVLLGKMIRLNVAGAFNSTYTIPPGNPFVGPPNDPSGTIRDEIWAKGLRNPFRWSFDRETGHIWIGDVGQGQREEVDFEPAGTPGRNYGWRIMEGTRCNIDEGPGCFSPLFTAPLIEYDSSDATNECSITGGTVYRGILPYLQGQYFYADFCSNQIWTYDTSNGVITERTAELTPDVSSIGSVVNFGEDGYGNLYIVDLGGEVFRVTLQGASCGAGPELALVLPLLGLLRRMRRRVAA